MLHKFLFKLNLVVSFEACTWLFSQVKKSEMQKPIAACNTEQGKEGKDDW